MFSRIILRVRDLEILEDEVRVGERVFPVASIEAIRVERDTDSGALGYKLVIAGYGGASAAILGGVLGGYLSNKFLFAAALTLGVGLSLLQDLIKMPSKEMFRLWLRLDDIDHLVFFAEGEREIEPIIAVLEPLTGYAVGWSDQITRVPPSGRRPEPLSAPGAHNRQAA